MSDKERAWRDTEFGQWHNSGLDGQLKGYTCEGPVRFEKRWWLIPAVGIYDFRLNPHHPLTLQAGVRFVEVGLPFGTLIQPSRSYETDKGSVPIRLQKFYRTDRFTGFYIHDSAYEFGYLWVKFPGTDVWVKWTCSRWAADYILMLAVGAQDGNALDRSVIYHAVRLGGGFVWNPAGKAKKRSIRAGVA